MDKLALGDPQNSKKDKPPKPQKEKVNWQLDSEGGGSPEQSDSGSEDENAKAQHKSYLHLLKGRKPAKGVPTKEQKLQIALREGRKREKAEKLYREEEQQMLRDKVLPDVARNQLFHPDLCHDTDMKTVNAVSGADS